MWDVLVIGAGQAGLATAHHLQARGIGFTLLESQPEAGGSWPLYYDSLKLFSPARHSGLPGLPFPGEPGRYPSRDETVAYLRQYAKAHQFPIRHGFRVQTVTQGVDGRFHVQAESGETLSARCVVSASGAFHAPHWPQLPGQAAYTGRLLHSMQYRDPGSFAGARVLVVGAANSAVQIAVELAEVATVSLAARRPPQWVRQRVLGADVHDWWRLFGLDRASPKSVRGWLFKALHPAAGPSVLDPGPYRRAVEAGRPDIRPMFERFVPGGIRWADGTEEPVDAVIFATGFEPLPPYLNGLFSASERGGMWHQAGVSQAHPGLFFVGLPYQRSFQSATLRGVGDDAAHVVRAIEGHLVASPEDDARQEASPIWRDAAPR